MEQKTRRRFDWRLPACALRSSPLLMKGASKRPAPTLPTNCLRVGIGCVVSLLILNAGGEVGGVDDGHQRALEREPVRLRLVVDRVQGAAVLRPKAGAVHVVGPVLLHAAGGLIAARQIGLEPARSRQARDAD